MAEYTLAPKKHRVVVHMGMALESLTSLAVVTVLNVGDFSPALAQRAKPIVIENDELKRKLLRLAYWQEARWWFFGALMAALLSQVIARNYKIDASWRLNWKIVHANGKLTLTPTHPQSHQPQPPELPN